MINNDLTTVLIFYTHNQSKPSPKIVSLSLSIYLSRSRSRYTWYALEAYLLNIRFTFEEIL